jgi:hypothetical protein
MTRNERWMVRAAMVRIEAVRTPAQQQDRERELRHSILEGEYERAMVAQALRAPAENRRKIVYERVGTIAQQRKELCPDLI